MRRKPRQKRAQLTNLGSQLSVSKEIMREYEKLNKPIGYSDALALNHRVYLEIKREDIGLPPF